LNIINRKIKNKIFILNFYLSHVTIKEKKIFYNRKDIKNKIIKVQKYGAG